MSYCVGIRRMSVPFVQWIRQCPVRSAVVAVALGLAVAGGAREASAQTLPFSDDFNDGNTTGWTPSGGTWTLVGVAGHQAYQQTDTTVNLARATAGATTWTNYSVQARLRMDQVNTEAGIISEMKLLARYRDDSNFYTVILQEQETGGGNLKLNKTVAGVTSNIGLTPLAVTLGTYYTVKMTLNGSSISVYVTDMVTPKLSVTDTSISSGSIGVATRFAKASFDDVAAHPIGTPPATPTGLTATPGDGQVSLSWTASSGATSYNVKRSTTTGGSYTTVGSPTGTTFVNTGLTNGTTYYFVVSAVNTAAESANSSQVSAVPVAPPRLTIFNPRCGGICGTTRSDYYPDGNGDSSNAFQLAINAASAYARDPNTDPNTLYNPLPALTNAQGVTVGPRERQAVVRVDANGVFMIRDVDMKSNVRLEIHTSSTLIPVYAEHQLMFNVGMPQATDNSNTLENVTITSWGGPSTKFRNRDGVPAFATAPYPPQQRCLNNVPSLTSPCSLDKRIQETATFPDGSRIDIENRFVIDLDYRRHPNAYPGTSTKWRLGDGPRGTAFKARQVRYFLIENALELAFPGAVNGPEGAPGCPPTGPCGIGSNSYPATAGNALAVDSVNNSPNDTTAMQPKNGTIRNLHCEGCTRGYGFVEVHAGVNLEYRYISSRGGTALRWESGKAPALWGLPSHQNAEQVIGRDCNAAVLISPHDSAQEYMTASSVKSFSCDDGIRAVTVNSEYGNAYNSSVTGVEIRGGSTGQVITCRNCGCKKYCPGYNPSIPPVNGTICDANQDAVLSSCGYIDDDFWIWTQSEHAINATLTTPAVDIQGVRCTAPGTFSAADRDVGGTCQAPDLQ
jgi:hypothetical protein